MKIFLLFLIILLFVIIFLSNNYYISEYFGNKIINLNMNLNNSTNQNNPNVVIPYYGPWYNSYLNYGYWNNYLPWNWFYPRYY